MNEKKYELTDETKVITHWTGKGHTLHRIRATKDFGGVRAGDLGGWVESEKNLSHEGDCWVAEEAMVYGNAIVGDNARVYGESQVYGDARVFGNAWVDGEARVCGSTRVFGSVQVCGDAVLTSGEFTEGEISRTPGKQAEENVQEEITEKYEDLQDRYANLQHDYKKIVLALFAKMHDAELDCEYYRDMEQRNGELLPEENYCYATALDKRHEYRQILEENILLLQYQTYEKHCAV